MTKRPNYVFWTVSLALLLGALASVADETQRTREAAEPTESDTEVRDDGGGPYTVQVLSIETSVKHKLSPSLEQEPQEANPLPNLKSASAEGVTDTTQIAGNGSNNRGFDSVAGAAEQSSQQSGPAGAHLPPSDVSQGVNNESRSEAGRTRLGKKVVEFDRYLDSQRPQTGTGPSNGNKSSGSQGSSSTNSASTGTQDSSANTRQGGGAPGAGVNPATGAQGTRSASQTLPSTLNAPEPTTLNGKVAKFGKYLDDQLTNAENAQSEAIANQEQQQSGNKPGKRNNQQATSEPKEDASQVAGSGVSYRSPEPLRSSDDPASANQGAAYRPGVIEDDVARLLREAAESETDPARKAALMAEYEEYVKNL